MNPLDFRRPSRIGRDAVVAVENLHDAFTRRLATAWSTSTHSAVELDHLATEQLSVDDYVRTLPNPTLLATLRVPRLGATALLDLDLPVSLLLVERLLGGPGDRSATDVTRRPTDLESALLSHELLTPAVRAVDDALRELPGEPAELIGLESTPQPLQLSAPGELLLLLTYRVEVRGDLPAMGLLSIGYPVAPLLAHIDRIVTGGPSEDDGQDQRSLAALTGSLLRAPVAVSVRLSGSTLPASAVARLEPGDILRLDHGVGRPAELVCDDRVVGEGHLGRRGRRLAIQVTSAPTTFGAGVDHVGPVAHTASTPPSAALRTDHEATT